MIWYTARQGERRGPFDEATLRAMAARGELNPTDLVWQAGDPAWRSASSVPGLLRSAEPIESTTASSRRTSGARHAEGHYLARHWRGELSLPVSYWVNGVLGTMVVAGLAALAATMDWTEGPVLAASVAASVLLFGAAVTLWQLVGIWRSAVRHPARGGSRGWAIAAQVMVVLGGLAATVDVGGSLLPQLRMTWEIATGDPRFSGHTLRVLRDASELELSGPIGFGLTAEVERTLDAHPTIDALHLNSPGGRIAEAKKLGGMIQERGLTTYVSGECSSACTLVFLGGAKRLIGPDARVGFHAFELPGARGLKAQIRDEGIAFYVAQGVDRAFARRALETPATGMWYPSRAELESAGVVTGVAAEGEFGLSGFTADELREVERELLEIDVFVALKAHEPQVYAAVMRSFKDGIGRGRSVLDIRREVMPLLQPLYLERLPHGDDASVLALSRVLVAQLRALGARSGRDCVRYMTPDASLEAALAVPRELREQETALLGDLVRSAATGRYGPKPGPAYERALGEVITRLERRWGAEVELLGELGHPDSRADPDKVCALAIELYETVLERPPAEAAQLLRTMYADE